MGVAWNFFHSLEVPILEQHFTDINFFKLNTPKGMAKAVGPFEAGHPKKYQIVFSNC